MKKIFIIVLALLVLGVIGIFLPEEKEEAQKDETSSSLNVKDMDDMELLTFKGHLRIGDKEELISEIYKDDERVSIDDSDYKKLLTFTTLAFQIDTVRINGEKLTKKISLDKSLDIAKQYLPKGFSSDYEFFDSGIISDEKDGTKSYAVLYEAYRHNICVSVSMKGDEMQLLEIIQRDQSGIDTQKLFTDEWEYKF